MRTLISLLAVAFLVSVASRPCFGQALHRTAPPAVQTQAERDAEVDNAMQSLRQRLFVKFSKGPRTAEAVAPELKEFDEVIAAHEGEKTEAVSRAYFMRAMLYFDVFHDYAKATKYSEEIRLIFLGMPASGAANAMLEKVREAQEAEAAPAAPAAPKSDTKAADTAKPTK
jgi:hypothetical protein